MSVKQFYLVQSEGTPFVVHLDPTLGKVFKHGNNRAGGKTKRYRRIFTSVFTFAQLGIFKNIL